MDLLEIKCPICKGTLKVNTASGEVVEHINYEPPKASFEDFLNSRKKGVAWDDKLKKAKEEQARRKAEIEMKFKQAKENPETPDLSEPLRTPLDWD
ncbi:MAG: hypothetical protein JW915_09295 [Chitinispirillaceae bacterium]|nr:hypothetical protein [Chitinispirillaceae bacterium]